MLSYSPGCPQTATIVIVMLRKVDADWRSDQKSLFIRQKFVCDSVWLCVYSSH